VFTISVPPLRDMDEDKVLLLEHYSRFYAEQAKLSPFSLDDSARKMWAEYHFPGNVRELRNICIRLTTKHAGQRLSAMELEPELDMEAPVEHAGAAAERDPEALIEQAARHLQRERGFNLDHMLHAWEQGYIEAAMKLTRGNVSQAAKMLGINRTTLYSRMESIQKQEPLQKQS
jgi:DNA-binding NtrC family response regulator